MKEDADFSLQMWPSIALGETQEIPPIHNSSNIHFSSKSDNWPTPQKFFDDLNKEFGPFDLDPCASKENAKCEKYFTALDDGLTKEWRGRVWMNPPYGRNIGHWMRKAWESVQSTALIVVCLVPVRTDTHGGIIPPSEDKFDL